MSGGGRREQTVVKEVSGDGGQLSKGVGGISIYMNASREQVVKSRTVCVGTAPRSVWREPGANQVAFPSALLRLTTRGRAPFTGSQQANI